MALNPILRSDWRFRTSSPKAVAVVTLFLSLLAVLTLLSLPPDLGRLDELGQRGLLRALLIVQAVLVAYFTSACGCGEIAIEGEKSVWDLAASAFSAGTIARGKAAASVLFASLLVALAVPFMASVAGIRGEPVQAVGRTAVVAMPFAAAMGSLGGLYGALFDSDFARSFVHWLTLVTLIVGGTALPSPWDLASPVRAVSAAVAGLTWPVLLAAGGYVAVVIGSVWATEARITAIRREARAT